MVQKFTGLLVAAAMTLMAGNAEDIKTIQALGYLKTSGAQVHSVVQKNDLYEAYIFVGGDKSTQGYKMLLDKELKNIIVGQELTVLDATSGQPLNRVDQEFMEELKTTAAFSYGSGPDEYIVFTDPECPYCKQFDKSLSAIKDRVKVYVHFFPLSFHKEAIPMVNYVLDQKQESRHKALLSISNDDKSWKAHESKDHFVEIRDDIVRGLKIGVKGTPALFNMSGQPADIKGFMETYMPKTVSKLDMNYINYLDKQGLLFSINPADNKPDLYVFTDTDCIACQDMLDAKGIEKLTETYKLNIILVPNQNHENSFLETVVILGNNGDLGRSAKFQELMSGGEVTQSVIDSLDEKLKTDEILKATVVKIGTIPNLVNQMGISSTPTFVDHEGNRVSAADLF